MSLGTLKYTQRWKRYDKVECAHHKHDSSGITKQQTSQLGRINGIYIKLQIMI